MTAETSKNVTHTVFVLLYWFFLLGTLGEAAIPKDRTPMLPFITLAIVAFGIWRVVRKQRRRFLKRRFDRQHRTEAIDGA